jgi:hypothetical protein
MSQVTNQTQRVYSYSAALILAGFAVPVFSPSSVSAAQPIRLHAENPHYFLWQGERTMKSPRYEDDIVLRILTKS